MYKITMVSVFLLGISFSSYAQGNKYYNLDSVKVTVSRTLYSYSNFSKGKTVALHLPKTPINKKSIFSEYCYIVTPLYNSYNQPIKLSSLSSKLHPFDTARLEVKLIVYQKAENNGQDIKYVLPIDPSLINNRIFKLDLTAYSLKLNEGRYYIGYSFKNKADKPIKYKMLQHKEDKANLLYIDGDTTSIMQHVFQDAFFFRLEYYKVL